MDLKIELKRFIRGYYFMITYNKLFYMTEIRIAELLGLNIIKYRIRLNKCLNNKGIRRSLSESSIIFFDSEEEKNQCIENFKEEFASELTLLQIQ